MPLPEGTRYRMKRMKGGGYERLAFKRGSNRVIEARNMSTGATHTPADFARDARKRGSSRTTQRQSGRR